MNERFLMMLGRLNIASLGLFVGAVGQYWCFGRFFEKAPHWMIWSALFIPGFMVFALTFASLPPFGHRPFRRCLLFAVCWYVFATLSGEALHVFGRIPRMVVTFQSGPQGCCWSLDVWPVYRWSRLICICVLITPRRIAPIAEDGIHSSETQGRGSEQSVVGVTRDAQGHYVAEHKAVLTGQVTAHGESPFQTTGWRTPQADGGPRPCC
jgi:hypothetical protein